MYKHTLSLCLCLCVTLTAFGQSARKVLDATAARMTQSGDVKASFKATQFSGTTPQGSTTGTMLISGRRFFMTSEDLTTWFDGTTQWSMLKDSHEVNISEPTDEEMAAMNPSILVNIYKRGFKFHMTESTLRGRPTYVVHMWPRNKDSEFSDIFVDIDQKDYTPLCIRAKRGNDWMRLAITSFQSGLQHPITTFTFPAKEYPGVEVIDLR